jgi:hypothetical protein
MSLAFLNQHAHSPRASGIVPDMSDDQLVAALRNCSPLPDDERVEAAAAISNVLKQTRSNPVRNAAAIALTDLIGAAATDTIVDVLERPEMASSAGSLLFALNEVEARLRLDLVVDLIERGSLEAQGEALTLLEDARLQPFTPDILAAAGDRLSAMLNRAGDTKVAHAAELAIAYLDDIAPETSQRLEV